MSILELPGELYFLIAEHLTSPCDLNHLLMAHRGLAIFIAPILAVYASTPTYAVAALFSFAASRNALRVKSHLEALRKRDPNITTDVESIISQGPNLVWDTQNDDDLIDGEFSTRQRALHWAVVNKKLAMIRYLISQGAEIDYRDPKTGGKAIDHAIRKGDVETVKILIESGADVRVWEDKCGSLLHCTILEYMQKTWLVTNLEETKAAYEEILVLLLRGGADVRICDVYGHTALHLAVFRWAEVIPLFLEWGADINAQDMFGNTPLHLAANFVPAPFTESIEKLQAMGADLTVKNHSGHDAYYLSKMRPLLDSPSNYRPTREGKDLGAKFIWYLARISSLGYRARIHSNRGLCRRR